MKNQDLLYYYLLKFKTEVVFLVVSFFTFLTPITGMVLLVNCAVGLDTAAGVYIARKNNNYQSDKLFNIVVKSFFYMGTILLAFLIDNFIFDKKLFDIAYLCSKSASMFWIYIECKSLDEKSQKLGNRPVYEIISNFIKKVKNIKQDINEIKE